MIMFKIKTQNKITKQGLDLFDRQKYAVSDGEQNPDAIIVRSADMHGGELNSELKAIARAGIGVNTIPVDKCANVGIVVFNTPGANANAVKELAVAALVLASRNVIDGVNWAKTLSSDVAKEVEGGKGKFAGSKRRSIPRKSHATLSSKQKHTHSRRQNDDIETTQ